MNPINRFASVHNALLDSSVIGLLPRREKYCKISLEKVGSEDKPYLQPRDDGYPIRYMYITIITLNSVHRFRGIKLKVIQNFWIKTPFVVTIQQCD